MSYDRNKQDKVILQEPAKFNKPNLLINIVKENQLGPNSLKSYNYFIRKLVNQDIKNYQKNEIQCNFKEVMDFIGVKNYKNYNEVFKYVNDLMNVKITYKKPLETNEKIIKTTTSNLVSSITYFSESNEAEEVSIKILDTFVIRFDTELTKDILLEYKYAKLDLIELNSLTSSYSIKLYELFCNSFRKHFQTKRNLLIKHNELKPILLGKKNHSKTYDTPSFFKRDCIDRPIKEVNKKTHLNISYSIDKEDKKNWIYNFEITRERTYNFKTWRKVIKKHLIDNESSILYLFDKKITKGAETSRIYLHKEGKDKDYYLYKLLTKKNTHKKLKNEEAEKVWINQFKNFKIDKMLYLKNMKYTNRYEEQDTGQLYSFDEDYDNYE